MYAFKALIASQSRAMRGSKARTRRINGSETSRHIERQREVKRDRRPESARMPGRIRRRRDGVVRQRAVFRPKPQAPRLNARMLAHPSGSASPNLPSASLRRISRHFPQIRKHSIRRTWKTDYSSCRKVKISASAFIYRGQTHFVIRKMGKLQCCLHLDKS